MVEDLLRACHINLMQISGKNLLKNIDSDHIMKSFKTLFDLPENIDKEKKKKALIVYLSSQSNSYSYDEEVDEEIDDEILTTSIVNDRSYESLYIPQYIIYPDFDEDDKPKFSRRIKY